MNYTELTTQHLTEQLQEGQETLTDLHQKLTQEVSHVFKSLKSTLSSLVSNKSKDIQIKKSCFGIFNHKKSRNNSTSQWRIKTNCKGLSIKKLKCPAATKESIPKLTFPLKRSGCRDSLKKQKETVLDCSQMNSLNDKKPKPFYSKNVLSEKMSFLESKEHNLKSSKCSFLQSETNSPVHVFPLKHWSSRNLKVNCQSSTANDEQKLSGVNQCNSELKKHLKALNKKVQNYKMQTDSTETSNSQFEKNKNSSHSIRQDSIESKIREFSMQVYGFSAFNRN